MCVDTFAPSYAITVSDSPGCTANWFEYLKMGKYASIEAARHFVPTGIETTGVFGYEANDLLHELGVRLISKSSGSHAYHFLLH